MYRGIVLVVSLFCIAAPAIQTVSAVPAFARKYRMSCATCHAPIPKLKPFGEEFAGNGFQLPGEEPARAYRDTGDDFLLLMRELPVSIRLDTYIRWQPESHGKTDLQTPYLLKIMSGGQIAKDISYYFYFFFSERGEIAGIEDALIMFNDVFGSDLDVSIGQFQVSDPLFKRELRLELEDYQIYRIRPGRSDVNLTYDRGIMFNYGLPTHTDLVFQILNGNGIHEADDLRNFDKDTYKNLFGRLTQEVGMGIRLGAFGYYGNEEREGIRNRLWMWGPDLTLSVGPVELNAQYVERQDDDPEFTGTAGAFKTRGGFAEVIVSPGGDKGKWYFAGLYNYAQSNPGGYKYQSATAHVSLMLARNIRMVGEYTYDIQNRANRYTVGFVTSF